MRQLVLDLLSHLWADNACRERLLQLRGERQQRHPLRDVALAPTCDKRDVLVGHALLLVELPELTSLLDRIRVLPEKVLTGDDLLGVLDQVVTHDRVEARLPGLRASTPPTLAEQNDPRRFPNRRHLPSPLRVGQQLRFP